MTNDEQTRVIEAFAVLTALSKKIMPLLDSKKDPSVSLRATIDAEMRDAYENSPVRPKSFAIMLRGTKVGTYSISETKAAPAETKLAYRIKSRDAFISWLNTMEGHAACVDYLLAHASESLPWLVMHLEGEIPDGIAPQVITTKNEVVGGEYKGNRISGFNEDAVFKILHDTGAIRKLPDILAMLFGGELPSLGDGTSDDDGQA